MSLVVKGKPMSERSFLWPLILLFGMLTGFQWSGIAKSASMNELQMQTITIEDPDWPVLGPPKRLTDIVDDPDPIG